MKNCRLRTSSPGVPGGTGVGEERGDWLALGLGWLGLGLRPAARGPRESLLADFAFTCIFPIDTSYLDTKYSHVRVQSSWYTARLGTVNIGGGNLAL